MTTSELADIWFVYTRLYSGWAWLLIAVVVFAGFAIASHIERRWLRALAPAIITTLAIVPFGGSSGHIVFYIPVGLAIGLSLMEFDLGMLGYCALVAVPAILVLWLFFFWGLVLWMRCGSTKPVEPTAGSLFRGQCDNQPSDG